MSGCYICFIESTFLILVLLFNLFSYFYWCPQYKENSRRARCKVLEGKGALLSPSSQEGAREEWVGDSFSSERYVGLYPLHSISFKSFQTMFLWNDSAKLDCLDCFPFLVHMESVEHRKCQSFLWVFLLLIKFSYPFSFFLIHSPPHPQNKYPNVQNVTQMIPSAQRNRELMMQWGPGTSRRLPAGRAQHPLSPHLHHRRSDQTTTGWAKRWRREMQKKARTRRMTPSSAPRSEKKIKFWKNNK